MQNLRTSFAAALIASVILLPRHSGAADPKPKLKPYPLETCSVSDEKLGEMGKPYVMEYKGREIKFCCKSCVKDFNKNPEKFIKKLEQAESKANK